MPPERRKSGGNLRKLNFDKSITTPIISPNFDVVKEPILDQDFDKFMFYFAFQVGGYSLLMIATECGLSKFVQELIARGADVNYQDGDDWTALMIAAKENQVDILSDLLEAGANVELRDMGGWTALMWAAYKGCYETVKLLLNKEASPNISDHNHMTPITWASGRGYLGIVNDLIANGAKVDNGDKYGTTPLIWACRKGHYEIAKKLLKAGANVDAIGMFHWTPLIVATRGNYEDIVDLLLTYKPNVNACDAQGLSPLMTACKEGNIDIVNSLLYVNSYVNLSDRNGDTSLIHASKAGYVLIVESLIKAHADVDHQGGNRKTALYWAVEKGHTEVVKVLLKANCNVELATKDGDTPLMKAVRSRKLAIIKILIDKKAKVSAVDKYGDTALHIATRAQAKAIMELLLRNPRNSQLLYKPNKHGETPFMLDNAHQKPLLPTLFGAAPSSRKILEKESQLGYDLYSSAIANLLSEPTLKTPICVGLFAKWGSGKSFLAGKLKDELVSFTLEWSLHPSFRFTWTLCVVVFMIAIICGVSALIGTGGKYIISCIVIFGCFALCFTCLAIIYCGHLHYNWSLSTELRKRLDKMKLILQICFGHPPYLDNEQTSTRPVRFLFTESPIKISTDYNVCQLIDEILTYLWSSLENQVGFLPVRLYRVFRPKHVLSSTWKWRRVCCMIPNVVIILFLFAIICLGITLYYINGSKEIQSGPAIGYLLVGVLSVTGAWILANITVPFKIMKEIVWASKRKSREDLKEEVELLHSCVSCLDALNGKNQTRLVIILDALESIYESERLISFFESINVYFLCTTNPNTNTSPPFVVIMALDPHHHITSKSKEYLKTIVHLPFYLQNSQLRRVRISQQTASKNDYRSSTTSLVEAIAAAPMSSSHFKTGGPTRRSKKNSSLLKSADSIISLSGPSGESHTKVLLTDDYFSDVNPKSLRRIMNIVYIEGRLLKAFNIDFIWHRLTTWVNITEQWPLRASAFIVYYEMNESRYNDDAIPLKTLYDKISICLPSDPELNSRDNDEKKLGIFLSFHNNSLTIGDLKVFAPFAINLDPHLKKAVQEKFSEMTQVNVGAAHGRSSTNNMPLVPNFSSTTKTRLVDLNVEGVIAMLKNIEGFDVSMIENYALHLRQHNINGRVLANCSPEDLNDLKKILQFSFGDWLLFKKVVLDGRLPYVAPAVHISKPASPPNAHSHNNPISNSVAGQDCVTISNIRHQSNLEKQVTMEGAALANAVDSPPNVGTISEESENDGEVGILYIGNSMNCGPRLSPSVSFTEHEHRNLNPEPSARVIDIEREPDDTTPLVSPSKNSITSSSSSSSSGKRRPLERQKTLDNTNIPPIGSKETIL
ncbi:kinase D-interacting substrate of 220 kDa-like isoform X2 [Dinothrombium tinctorium]|uniref:Kinase D-interacting substrate of 220 kDa-like isoform X2 n=1 Tax=Dinothrombium tinctorium TaxID=1965070 RepID=A0A443QVJ5_9ACAR|nr:kinase D-interacting substrate of 220 kDa-like isoform X2 [Dinothrombium tinctorium]